MQESIPPELLEFLQQQEWGGIHTRLVAHAHHRMRRMGLPLEGIKGHDPESVATDAITKVFDGVRKPKPKDLIDFEYYLGSVVNSLIFALKVSKENQTKSGDDVDTLSDEKLVDSFFDHGFLNELETTEILDKIGNDLLTEGKDDMFLVYCEMRNGNSNQEIAKGFGRSVKEIENIKRQLYRYFERIRPQK